MSHRKALSLFDKVKIATIRLNKEIRCIVNGEQAKGSDELMARLRMLPEFQGAKDEYIAEHLHVIDLRKCRDVVAIEHGYENWQALSTAIAGSECGALSNEQTELYRFNISDFRINAWFSDYDEAKDHLDRNSRCFLLTYKGYYFIAPASHIEELGLDPNDPDWEKIGWDWAKPKDGEAKARLHKKLRGK